MSNMSNTSACKIKTLSGDVLSVEIGHYDYECDEEFNTLEEDIIFKLKLEYPQYKKYPKYCLELIKNNEDKEDNLKYYYFLYVHDKIELEFILIRETVLSLRESYSKYNIVNKTNKNKVITTVYCLKNPNFNLKEYGEYHGCFFLTQQDVKVIHSDDLTEIIKRQISEYRSIHNLLSRYLTIEELTLMN